MLNPFFTRALTLGAFTLFATQQTVAAQAGNVKPPYKIAGNIVVFQPAANIAPEVVAGANPADFKIIYKADHAVIARSGVSYYCNAQKLPQTFEPAAAHMAGDFVFFAGKGWAGCELLDYAVDGENFEALDFPFFTDRKVVLTISGKQIKGADAATFETLANNQARDKNQYYFVADKDVAIPWKRRASAYPPCYGWGNVDGELYYAGVKQPQADAASFRCFSFNIAADKEGFYIYGKPQAVIPADAQVKNITPLSDNSFSDGKYVWFVGVDATLLSGINAGKAKVEDIDGGEKVSDGVTGWQCTTTKTSDEPSCRRV